MRRLLPLLLLVLVGCSFDPVPAPTPPRVAKSKVQLLLFTQDNCLPCKLLKAQLHDPATADIIGSFELAEVMPPDPRFKQYGITATPALIALTPRGTVRYEGQSLGMLRDWLHDQAAAQAVIGKISEGGPTSPDGKAAIVCDLPASERKKNIASRGLGCCVFRSIEYAARWQQVPELYDLPEQMVHAGIEGGGYPEKVTRILQKFGPQVQYIQDTSGDPEILEAILRSGRLPCVTYNGRDGVHYHGPIAHMVCLPYFDRAGGWACVCDNNFPGAAQFLWMSCDEFLTRWRGGGGGGWVVALLSTPPPPVPHN